MTALKYVPLLETCEKAITPLDCTHVFGGAKYLGISVDSVCSTRPTIEVARFRQKCFLNDGVPYPKIVGILILFRKMTFV